MKKRLCITIITLLLAVALCAALCACDFVKSIMGEVLEDVENGWMLEDDDSGNGNGSGNGESTGRTEEKTDVHAATGDVVLAEGDLSFHFLTLGNKYTGDSTYIKIGDVDILIDAGSRQNSAAPIIEYVNQYCTDGKLEYVIATHAHQDHIAGFVGTKSGGVLNSFEIGTIIEFARTNSTSAIYGNYCAARDAAVEKGAKCYTALQCWNNEDGAQRSYTLAEGVTMDVLNNYYYKNKTSDENNYSVCVMFNYGDSHYLFTGDLETEGESYLVDGNDLPHCKLFKGGHHGSYTANTAKLMQVIQPDVVCVCCCAGTPEYTENMDNTFPSQAFFDRVLPYTDQIFVTTMVDEIIPPEDEDDDPDWTVKDMNGNIVVVTDGVKLDVHCSASAVSVTETDWFRENRKRN